MEFIKNLQPNKSYWITCKLSEINHIVHMISKQNHLKTTRYSSECLDDVYDGTSLVFDIDPPIWVFKQMIKDGNLSVSCPDHMKTEEVENIAKIVVSHKDPEEFYCVTINGFSLDGVIKNQMTVVKNGQLKKEDKSRERVVEAAEQFYKNKKIASNETLANETTSKPPLENGVPMYFQPPNIEPFPLKNRVPTDTDEKKDFSRGLVQGIFKDYINGIEGAMNDMKNSLPIFLAILTQEDERDKKDYAGTFWVGCRDKFVRFITHGSVNVLRHCNLKREHLAVAMFNSNMSYRPPVIRDMIINDIIHDNPHVYKDIPPWNVSVEVNKFLSRYSAANELEIDRRWNKKYTAKPRQGQKRKADVNDEDGYRRIQKSFEGLF